MSKQNIGHANKLLLVIVLACTPFLSACTGGDANGAKVMGTVTVNGQPAQSGALTFIPLDRKQAKTGASILEDGTYETRAALGKSKVEIRIPVVVGQEKRYDGPDSPMMDVTRESLPYKYNKKTELEIDVVSGTNSKDWELVTKKKEAK